MLLSCLLTSKSDIWIGAGFGVILYLAQTDRYVKYITKYRPIMSIFYISKYFTNNDDVGI